LASWRWRWSLAACRRPFVALIPPVAPRRALMVGVGLLILFLGFHGLWQTLLYV
jgi:hypothetical protein